MPAYISEIHYDGSKTVDFFEIAVPEGTDVSGYTLEFYDSGGNNYNTKPLGTPVTTEAGHDVYVIDSSVAFFPDSRSGHGVALVDGDGNVVQFVSYGSTPSTISATNGSAGGLTSTYIGSAPNGSSLETTDGGATYQTQSSPNPGTIPAPPPCYAPGTLIDTPDGPRPVETLQVGDLVTTLDHGPQPVRWIRSGDQPLEAAETDAKPVLIAAGALGGKLPAQDLIVSPQHRILVGGHRQLQGRFKAEAFAPAKSLTKLKGIRHMKGKQHITWVHFACDRHEVVTANGCLSESLLLGPMVVNGLTAAERQAVTDIFGPAATPDAALNGPPARECFTVGAVRRQLANSLEEKGQGAANEIRKWDADAAMERYEAERLREEIPKSLINIKYVA